MGTAMVTIKQAAEILDLGYLQARISLGDPQDYEIAGSGRKKLLYSMDRVLEVKRRRDEVKALREKNKGTAKCYHCGERVEIRDLTSGICSKCQAFKIIKNFACHGDYIHGSIDMHRLEKVIEAVMRLQAMAESATQSAPQDIL
jgi:hypothetical protein